MKKLTLRKGWYGSVGRKFGWINDGYNVIGVGIDKPLLVGNKALIVRVNKEDYHVDCERAIAFIKQYRAFENYGKARLGFISRSLMVRIGEPKPKKIKEPVKIPEPKQISIYEVLQKA